MLALEGSLINLMKGIITENPTPISIINDSKLMETNTREKPIAIFVMR